MMKDGLGKSYLEDGLRTTKTEENILDGLQKMDGGTGSWSPIMWGDTAHKSTLRQGRTQTGMNIRFFRFIGHRNGKINVEDRRKFTLY